MLATTFGTNTSALHPISSSIKTGQSTYILNISGSLAVSMTFNGKVQGVALSAVTYTSEKQFIDDVTASLAASSFIGNAYYMGSNGLGDHRWHFSSNFQNQLTLEDFVLGSAPINTILSVQFWGGIDQVPMPVDLDSQLLQKKTDHHFITDTAQAGGSTSITLAAGASAVNDYYVGLTITIASGTGAGQSNIITDYVGSTKVATVGTTWNVNPDNTSVYEIEFDIIGYALPNSYSALPVWNLVLVDTGNTFFPVDGQAFNYAWDDRLDFFLPSVAVYGTDNPYRFKPSDFIPQ